MIGSSPCSARKDASDDFTAILTTTPPSRRPRELWSLNRPGTSTSPMRETPQGSMTQVAHLLHPWCEGPCPAERSTEPMREIRQELTKWETGVVIVVAGAGVAESLSREYERTNKENAAESVVT